MCLDDVASGACWRLARTGTGRVCSRLLAAAHSWRALRRCARACRGVRTYRRRDSCAAARARAPRHRCSRFLCCDADRSTQSSKVRAVPSRAALRACVCLIVKDCCVRSGAQRAPLTHARCQLCADTMTTVLDNTLEDEFVLKKLGELTTDALGTTSHVPFSGACMQRMSTGVTQSRAADIAVSRCATGV